MYTSVEQFFYCFPKKVVKHIINSCISSTLIRPSSVLVGSLANRSTHKHETLLTSLIFHIRVLPVPLSPPKAQAPSSCRANTMAQPPHQASLEVGSHCFGGQGHNVHTPWECSCYSCQLPWARTRVLQEAWLILCISAFHSGHWILLTRVPHPGGHAMGRPVEENVAYSCVWSCFGR